MTPKERFLACMRFQDVDHVPLWEWGPWPSTLLRWHREGLGEGHNPPQFAECDARIQCGVDLWMRPRYKEGVVLEEDEYVIRRTDRGVLLRELRSPEAVSMPEHLKHPVKNQADWEQLKTRFRANDAERFPKDWPERCARWQREGPVLIFQGPRAPSLFGFVRELMGVERTLTALYDEPQLVHEMMEHNTEFIIQLLPRVLDEAPVSTVFFWEDMCYKGGPLISPAMFREFMLPRYRRINDLVRSRGVEAIFVDCDGDVSQLIPLWLEAGINGIYPLEVAAGMDVAGLRREYGRELLMTGGIDKRALAEGPEAIDRELARVAPVAEQGGYIPHLDHAVPHDVSYANFAYYWERKKRFLGIQDRERRPCDDSDGTQAG